VLLLAALWAFQASADSATVAVAANFLGPLELLQQEFEANGEHTLVLASGSTGQLYTQVTNGAPFDVFLSADEEHVNRLLDAGLAAAGTRFTYAIGKLALFTRNVQKFRPLDLKTLERADFRWLAIAHPDLAPYGLAARQTLTALGLWDALQPRIVRGQSIAQTFAMAETRNADLALVAQSQVLAYSGVAASYEVPAELHDALRQDAVLLVRAEHNAAARAFLAFLASDNAARIIESQGYRRPP
jgi:molybdate transport system substrate-binding protein